MYKRVIQISLVTMSLAPFHASADACAQDCLSKWEAVVSKCKNVPRQLTKDECFATADAVLKSCLTECRKK
jgi:hypothetical protein